MLCRVADSMFWMSRYLERAENTCQFVDVHLQLLLDSGSHQEEDPFKFWSPVLYSLGEEEQFAQSYDDYTHENVTNFLTFSTKNPSSIVNCVFSARENARMIRDQISTEMFEVINRLYLKLRQNSSSGIGHNRIYDHFIQIREMVYLINGFIGTTVPRLVGYEFIKAGQYLERADKTGRLIHSWVYKTDQDKGSEVENDDYLLSILRSCNALKFYQQEFKNRVLPKNVIQLLLLSRAFPRAVFFSLLEFQKSIHSISKCPTTHYSNEVERLSGLLISELNYLVLNDVVKSGIHPYLEKVHENIETIAVEFSKQYMFFPVIDPSSESQTQ